MRRNLVKPGFTLVELLVVISIIALLVALLVPWLSRARELARQAACKANQRSLVQADISYHNAYGCLCPIGYRTPGLASDPGGSALAYWYQKQFMGQFFNEDIPFGINVPPKKSYLRCPSEAVYPGITPDASWIAYNSYMSYQYEPPGSNLRCFYRGPRLDEITNPSDRFLLFADGRGNGIYYVGDYAYNDGSYYDSTGTRSNIDERHLGGENVSFLDGHVAYFPSINNAYLGHLINVSPTAYTK